jgi:hypothetical protein
MSFFWQHVGDANSKRDFPRTLGGKNALKEFSIVDVKPYLSDVSPIHQAEVERNFARIGKTTFQIWGLPVGAVGILKKLEVGDYLLLLDSNADWGSYVGRVLYYLPEEHWSLSEHLWREAKFPLIVLLRGAFIHYPWPRFLSDFRYGHGLKPMGRTARIADYAFANGPAPDDESFYEYLIKGFPPLDPNDGHVEAERER